MLIETLEMPLSWWETDDNINGVTGDTVIRVGD